MLVHFLFKTWFCSYLTYCPFDTQWHILYQCRTVLTCTMTEKKSNWRWHFILYSSKTLFFPHLSLPWIQKILKYLHQKYLVASIPFKDKRFHLKRKKNIWIQPRCKTVTIFPNDASICCVRGFVSKIPASPPHSSPLRHKPSGLALDGLKDLERSEMKATRVNAYTRSALVEKWLKMKKKGTIWDQLRAIAIPPIWSMSLMAACRE